MIRELIEDVITMDPPLCFLSTHNLHEYISTPRLSAPHGPYILRSSTSRIEDSKHVYVVHAAKVLV